MNKEPDPVKILQVLLSVWADQHGIRLENVVIKKKDTRSKYEK